MYALQISYHFAPEIGKDSKQEISDKVGQFVPAMAGTLGGTHA